MIDAFYNRAFPILEIDEHYVLREQEIKDTEAFFNYYSQPRVGQYIFANKPRNISEASAEIHYCRSLYRYRRGIYWTIARKEDDLMIGAIGLHINNQHHRAEICYDLNPDFWQQGITTRAMQKVVEHCFSPSVGIQRIEAITVPENIASIAVLKKLGFEFEGALRRYRYFQDKSHDIVIYSIINPDPIIHANYLYAKSGIYI